MLKSSVDSVELRKLGQSLIELANQIDDGGRSDDRAPMSGATHCQVDPVALAQKAAIVWSARQIRREFFPPDIFGEPSWDMLLDLFAMRAGKKLTSVKSVCLASNAPTTTALRWLTVLEKHGLIESSESTSDLRVRHVRLTDDAYQKMISFFEASVAELL